jgi:hypothetical protein
MQRRPYRPLAVEWLEPREMLSTSAQIIDDGAAGYSSLGSWLYSSGQGYGGDVRYSALGTGNDVARWTFNVTPGQYRVSASWFAHSNRASNAPYTILDGSNVLGTVRVSQKVAANDVSDAGTNWEYLGGPYNITSNTLVVTLSDAANGYVIADAVRVEPYVVPTIQIVDNGNVGFSKVGNWPYSTGQGYGGDVHYSALGSGSDLARWTFTVTPGRYRVSASWFAHANRASNAPYTVFNGGTALGTVRVSQKVAANDFSDAGVSWEDLGGPYDITGNTLVVELSDAANGYVIADAVRIEAQNTPPPPIGGNEHIFIAQSATGADNGTSSANAHSASWFNIAANWGAGAGQINAGDTVHLIGTITSPLTVQGSGSAGNAITLLFESGAKLSQAYWSSSTGALNLGSRSYITVDGNNTGLIEATANGSGLANQQNTLGIIGSGSNLIVKNLTIQNLYQHTSPTDTAVGTATAMHFENSSDITLDGVTVRNARAALNLFFWQAVSNITVKNCDFGNVDAGINLASNAGAWTISNISIHNNKIHDYSNWDTPTNTYHHDGIHGWGAGVTYSNLQIYNNRFYGNIGNNITAHIFLQSSTYIGTKIFNNVFQLSNAPVGGDGHVAIGGAGDYLIANNSFESSTVGNWMALELGAGTITVKNNIFSKLRTFIWKGSGASLAAGGLDNNIYAQAYDSLSWRYDASLFSSLSSWQSATGQDANSQYSSAALNLGSELTLPSGSIAINAGTNLTSLGITALNSDRLAIARPASGPWEAGAYES